MSWGKAMLVVALLAGGCNEGGSQAPPDMTPPPDPPLPELGCIRPSSPSAKYVVSKISIPATGADHAWDLNGDGAAENALGTIAQVLGTQGIDLPTNAAEAVRLGELQILIVQQSGSDLDEDTCTQTRIYGGQKPATPPRYDGTDKLTVDTTTQRGLAHGEVKLGVFTSAPPPATTTMPVTFTLKVPFVIGKPPVTLAVTGGRITYRRSGPNLIQGQLNGAVRKSQFDEGVIPPVVALLNEQIVTNAPSRDQILTVFDIGGCTDSNGVPAVAMDGIISHCEVVENSIVQGVLAPDVQLYTGGMYQPNPANTARDSVSIGIGFEAVPADFTIPAE